ncbi:MAG: 2OG-Fe(II) oxygenase [Pseudoxanthomonas suwonensis]|nr:2OG-Fe(II) oxygenase [Pseudoxanthomonas suwonensis]
MEITISRDLAVWLDRQLAAGVALQDIRRALLLRGAGSEAVVERLCANLLDRGARLRDALHADQCPPLPTAAASPPPPDPEATPTFVPCHRLPVTGNHVDIDGCRVDVLLRVESPHAVVVDGILDAKQCHQLIASARGHLQPARVIDGKHGGECFDERRSSELVSYQRAETPWIDAIERRIAALTGIPLEHGEGLQVMRYGVGAEYQPHFDHFRLSEPGEAAHLAHGGQRTATLVMYLNDVDDGGETVFPEAGVAVTPRRGRAVYFAYADAEGNCDTRAFHGGAPVRRGEKWIATKWFRQRPHAVVPASCQN